ncbi:MAG: PA14 domain-containing protein [Candidatus Brocadiia bacterium]
MKEKSAAGEVSFSYELKESGRVSAAVYDTEGHLLRELLRAEKQKPGQHIISWDGLDREGNPQKPGEYQWRVLRTPGFRAEYVTNLGINPDSVPYDKWVGNHGGPASVEVDSSGMYIAATVTETAPVLLKQSLGGKERFWTRGRGDVTTGRFQGGVSLASDGEGTLYMLQQNAYVQVIDAKSGHRRGTWDLLPEDDERREDGRLKHRRYKHGQAISMIDLDARGRTVVISYHDRDKVCWVSPDDGSVQSEVAIENPWGVEVGSNDEVFVISSKKIVKVAASGEQSVVVAAGMISPRRLAIDQTSGDLLVSEFAPTHQVKRFSPKGKLQSTYGRKGGRQDGLYVPTDFLHITSICSDGQDGFVVTEERTAPRRVARFNGEGQLVKEWYGGQPYYTWGEPDTRNPLRVWFNPGSWLTLAEIDAETKKWRVLENYRQSELGGGLVRTVTGHRGRWHVLYRGDQRYLVSEGVPHVLLHEKGALRAVAVVSNDARQVSVAAEMAGYEEKARSFRWLDKNRDGTPQGEEFTFSPERHVPRGRWVSDKFEIVGFASGRGEDGAFVRVTSTHPKWTQRGPVYPIGNEDGVNNTAGEMEVPSPATTGGTRGACAFRDRKGDYYAIYNTSSDRHGTTWPTEWGGRSRVVRWDSKGNKQWEVGRHAIHGGLGSRPHTTPPGYLHVPAAMIGEIRNTVVMTDRVEWMGLVWTKDGLCCGDVLDGRVEDGLPEICYYWWRTPSGKEAIITSDNATGGAIVENDDGSVYFFTQGRNSVPVYKIHGWEDWKRFNGKIELKAEPLYARGEGKGLTARYYRIKSEGGSEEITELFESGGTDFDEPNVVRVDRQVWHGVPRHNPGNHTIIDGFRGGPAYDWSEGVKLLKKAEGGQLGLNAMAKPSRAFGVRWTGEIESPLTEIFVFSVYHRGRVRLWIDGQQKIFGWNESRQRRESGTIELRAGKRYSIQLDFKSEQLYPACSLNWESSSIDRRRIPQKYLYPAEIEVADKPDVRDARTRIPAFTFDETNIETDDRRNYTRGLRQRGIGTSGAYLGFKRIDFGEGSTKLKAMARGNPAGRNKFDVSFTFKIDNLDGSAIAKVSMRDGKMRERPVELKKKISGIHDVYVVNTSPKRWHFIGLKYFVFK